MKHIGSCFCGIVEVEVTGSPEGMGYCHCSSCGSNSRPRRMSFLRELFSFIRVRRKFWLIPIFAVMLVLGGLLVLTKGSALAPFVYTLF